VAAGVITAVAVGATTTVEVEVLHGLEV